MDESRKTKQAGYPKMWFAGENNTQIAAPQRATSQASESQTSRSSWFMIGLLNDARFLAETAPQDKGQAGVTPHGLSRDCPAPRKIPPPLTQPRTGRDVSVL